MFLFQQPVEMPDRGCSSFSVFVLDGMVRLP
jgi:hypothetical protein